MKKTATKAELRKEIKQLRKGIRLVEEREELTRNHLHGELELRNQLLNQKQDTISALQRLIKSQSDQINQFTAERQAIGDAYQRGVDAWRASKGETFEMPPNRADLIGWLLDRIQSEPSGRRPNT